MSFQAYLDTIEEKTGLTPRQILDIANSRGYDGPEVKAGVILEWLKADHGLAAATGWHWSTSSRKVRRSRASMSARAGATGTSRAPCGLMGKRPSLDENARPGAPLGRKR